MLSFLGRTLLPISATLIIRAVRATGSSVRETHIYRVKHFGDDSLPLWEPLGIPRLPVRTIMPNPPCHNIYKTIFASIARFLYKPFQKLPLDIK